MPNSSDTGTGGSDGCDAGGDADDEGIRVPNPLNGGGVEVLTSVTSLKLRPCAWLHIGDIHFSADYKFKT
jgi:hypothetical protein